MHQNAAWRIIASCRCNHEMDACPDIPGLVYVCILLDGLYQPPALPAHSPEGYPDGSICVMTVSAGRSMTAGAHIKIQLSHCHRQAQPCASVKQALVVA